MRQQPTHPCLIFSVFYLDVEHGWAGGRLTTAGSFAVGRRAPSPPSLAYMR